MVDIITVFSKNDLNFIFCGSDLANSSKVGSDLSTLAGVQSGFLTASSRAHRNVLLSIIATSHVAETAIGIISVLTFFDPGIPATDKNFFRP